MKIHHWNAATMCPYGGSWSGGDGPPWKRARMVCHCLVIETDAHGVVLVDTGLGTADHAAPSERLGAEFVWLTNPEIDPAQTLLRQLEQHGFHADDVRHVVLTHLDLDHAGGISDFPHAKIHVMADEHAAATLRPTLAEKQRYRPCQWEHGADFVLHRAAGEPWRGAPCVRALPGLPPEILLIPLVGHSRGHACVAIEGGHHDGRTLLHAGDAYFHRNVLEDRPIPSGLQLFERTVAIDRTRLDANHARLRELAASGEVCVFSAHDPVELERLTGAT